MPNNIAFVRNYTSMIDEVYQRAAVSGCLNSPRRMARAGRNAREIMIPKIEVTGLGDYTRSVGYKTGSITYKFETKTFEYLPVRVPDIIVTGYRRHRETIPPAPANQYRMGRRAATSRPPASGAC